MTRFRPSAAAPVLFQRGRRWRDSPGGVDWAAKATAAIFALLVAIGGLVKAIDGSAIGIVVAAVGVVGAFTAGVFVWLRGRAEDRAAERALVRAAQPGQEGPRRVGEALAGAGIYGIGVPTTSLRNPTSLSSFLTRPGGDVRPGRYVLGLAAS
jgi:hypothetical protein